MYPYKYPATISLKFNLYHIAPTIRCKDTNILSQNQWIYCVSKILAFRLLSAQYSSSRSKIPSTGLQKLYRNKDAVSRRKIINQISGFGYNIHSSEKSSITTANWALWPHLIYTLFTALSLKQSCVCSLFPCPPASGPNEGRDCHQTQNDTLHSLPSANNCLRLTAQKPLGKTMQRCDI